MIHVGSIVKIVFDGSENRRDARFEVQPTETRRMRHLRQQPQTSDIAVDHAGHARHARQPTGGQPIRTRPTLEQHKAPCAERCYSMLH